MIRALFTKKSYIVIVITYRALYLIVISTNTLRKDQKKWEYSAQNSKTASNILQKSRGTMYNLN